MENQKSNTPLPFARFVLLAGVSLVILALIASVVFGKQIIGKIQEALRSEEVKVDQRTNRTNGAQSGATETNLPDVFPSDFPMYPGAKATGTIAGKETQGGKGLWVLLETPDALSRVISFYDKNLETTRWTVEEKDASVDSASYIVAKEKLAGTIILSEEQGKTSILVTLSPLAKEEVVPSEDGADIPFDEGASELGQ
jgi:hypothetical protein